jgi:hypothetical protein
MRVLGALASLAREAGSSLCSEWKGKKAKAKARASAKARARAKAKAKAKAKADSLRE